MPNASESYGLMESSAARRLDLLAGESI